MTHKIDPKTPLPVLPLRNIVVFPNMIVPLFVGRDKSVNALEEVMTRDKQILLVAQKDEGIDDPGLNDFYRVGAVGNVLQMLKLPDGTVKVLVEGVVRVRLNDVEDTEDYFQAKPEIFQEREGGVQETEALVRTVVTEFEEYVKLNKKIPPEVLVSMAAIDEPARLADTIASHLNLKLEEKQELLELDLGDVLVLNRPANDNVILSVDGKDKFNANLGLNRHRKTVQITEVLKTEHDTVKDLLLELEDERRAKLQAFKGD